MQVETFWNSAEQNWLSPTISPLDPEKSLLVLFGDSTLLDSPEIVQQITSRFAPAPVIGCSTAGEIYGTDLQEHSIVIAILRFSNTSVSEESLNPNSYTSSHLAIPVSCVGRKMVWGERAEEEFEATLDVLPTGTHQTGFYSYGELSPFADGTCELHKQTMTLTTRNEK